MSTTQDATKARLLEAAGEEFAAKGYESARVRSICERAGANLAAVNYHFGDKEQLYVQAVVEAYRFQTRAFPDAIPDGTPAEQLRLAIHSFLANVLAMNRARSWHHDLMMREIVSPTHASEALVRDAIRPRFELMRGVVRRACPEADGRRLDALTFSVIGQCLHYKMAAVVCERLIGKEAFASLDLEYLTQHITSFCLAALGLGPALDRAGEPTGQRVAPTSATSPPRGEGGEPCPGSR